MKIEWSYKGQDTYQSYKNCLDLNESYMFWYNLYNNKTDYDYNKINAVRIEINTLLWISITKNYFGKEEYHLMASDNVIGKLYSRQDISIFIREFNAL